MTERKRPDWAGWSLVMVLMLLAAIEALTLSTMLETRDRINTMANEVLVGEALPCRALPLQFVRKHPECSQALLDAMNVTNVHIHSARSRLSEVNDALETVQSVNEINRQNRLRMNASKS